MISPTFPIRPSQLLTTGSGNSPDMTPAPSGSGHELQPTDSLPACAWELLRLLPGEAVGMAMYCSNMLLKYSFNIHQYMFVVYIYTYIYIDMIDIV